LKTGCEEIKHYQRKLKEKTCQQLKDALYGCSCGSVVKEKKACKTFDQCYAAAVTNKKSNEKEIKKKMLLPSSSGVQLVVLNASIKVMSGKKKRQMQSNWKNVKGPQISTKPLDLKYHLTPPKPKCALAGLDDKIRQMCDKPKEPKKTQKMTRVAKLHELEEGVLHSES